LLYFAAGFTGQCLLLIAVTGEHPSARYLPYDGSGIGGDQQVQENPHCLPAEIQQEIPISGHPVVFL
jgi:hypothetical protein